MILAAHQPLQVEQVGQGFADFLIGLAGPALISCAAVIAAYIAAKTAYKRQRAQLAHDLTVRSIEHIRDAIDQAVEVVHETSKAFADFRLSIPDWEEKRPGLEAELEADDTSPDARQKARDDLVAMLDEVTDEHGAAIDRLVEMVAMETRLKLRLGSNNDIPQLTSSLRAAWQRFAASLMVGQTDFRSSEQIEETEAIEAEADGLYSEFHLACERWLTEWREAQLHLYE